MTPTPDPDLIETALARLGAQTGLKLVFDPSEGSPGAEGQVRILDGLRQWTYDILVRPRMDRITSLLGVQAQPSNQGRLLITPYLTPGLARACQAMGLSFLDAAGNAFLKGEGLFVRLAGQRPDKTPRRTAGALRAFDRAGLKVLFTLLAAPDLLQATYREIAKSAGVALGTVGTILAELKDQGLLADFGAERRWIDRPRVLQAWVTNYPLRLRGRLHSQRFTARQDRWWETAQPEAYGGCWSGEVAIAQMQGDLIPKTVTVYLPGDRKAFLAKHRLRADPQGEIEILDAFWPLAQTASLGPGLAPPLLVHADLLTIGDPRTLEEARRLYEHHLA